MISSRDITSHISGMGNSMSHMKNLLLLIICWDFTSKDISEYFTMSFLWGKICVITCLAQRPTLNFFQCALVLLLICHCVQKLHYIFKFFHFFNLQFIWKWIVVLINLTKCYRGWERNFKSWHNSFTLKKKKQHKIGLNTILCLKLCVCEAQIHVLKNKCQNEAWRFIKKDMYKNLFLKHVKKRFRSDDLKTHHKTLQIDMV